MLGGFFTAIALERAVLRSEEKRAGLLRNACETDGIAHAKEADHLPGEGGSAFEIVFGAGADVFERELFGGAATKKASNAVQ